MSVSRDLFDLRTGGLYLPSLILLIIQPEIPYVFIVAFGGLLAAVYFHGLMRAVFGVGGPEENPLKRRKAIQGIQVAVSGKGPQHEMPDSFPRMIASIFRNPMIYGFRAIVLAVIGVITLVIWIPAVGLSLVVGVHNFEQLGTGTQLLVFAEFVWILQWIIWRFFTPSHLLEESDFG